jgi:hypothetical protein
MQTTFAIPPKSKSDLSPKASGSKSPNQIRKSQTQQSKQINDVARFSGLVDENYVKFNGGRSPKQKSQLHGPYWNCLKWAKRNAKQQFWRNISISG